MIVPGSTAFGTNMALPVHRWFRYSAGFSGAWAEQVVRETGARRVLDPFAGSGTTVLAAEAAGAEGLGVEAHPFVARVARAKLLWRADPRDSSTARRRWWRTRSRPAPGCVPRHRWSRGVSTTGACAL